MGDSKERSLADPRLLETIDKLFELNIGEYVALPQLLVVGDQSSGKSSVLEGLTELPFPRDSGLCTRFATQITFRRALETRISISVIPAGNAEEGYRDKLRAWRKDDLQTLNRSEFAAILQEAQDLMGVGLPSQPGKRTFSDDVLKIEICGPDQQHLSVVDVPGIFRRITEGVTTQGDKAMVRNMIVSYMQNPRSVILAVIPSNVDVATQEILDMASDIDKNGQRTLGVLTKPDLVDRGAHHEIIRIMEGKVHKLTLGWSIVRNPGQEDLMNASWDRHAEEKFFFRTDARYNKLPTSRVGIPALEARLGEILAELVRNEFPHVKADINKKLIERTRELDDMGPSRETKEQQHRYLLGLAARFQEVTSLALRAHYGSDGVFDRFPNLKLATMIVSRNELFSRDVSIRGHAIRFGRQTDAGDSEDEDQEEAGDTVEEVEKLEVDYCSEDEDQEETGDTFEEAEKLEVDDYYEDPRFEFDDQAPLLLATKKPRTANRYTYDHADLDDLSQLTGKAVRPKSQNIIQWLEDLYKGSRGFELGTFDASIIPIIWKKQSANWEEIALGYTSDVVSVVHGFIVGLLRACSVEERVLSGLLAVLMEPITARYKNAIDHTKFLLLVERAGTPLTANHYFADNLEKCRQQRMKKLMEPNIINDPNLGRVVKLSSIVNNHPLSNVEHTVRDLHDIVKSYYKVARKRFVDEVCMQAADHHLVNGPDTPIKVFSPAFVTDLTTEQLDRIAGENLATRKKRVELQREITNLEAGRKVLI